MARHRQWTWCIGSIVLRHDDRFFYCVERQQSHFDFSHLDTLATNLHLKIFSAEMLQTTIRTQPPNIPGTIEACALIIRVRHKHLPGQGRLTPVAWRQITTPHHDLAKLARRNGLPSSSTTRMSTSSTAYPTGTRLLPRRVWRSMT